MNDEAQAWQTVIRKREHSALAYGFILGVAVGFVLLPALKTWLLG